DFGQYHRVVIVQIGLVGKKTVPVVRFRNRIPGPVGFLGVRENDARVTKFLYRVAPHIKIAFRGTRRTRTGSLKPGMLVGRVVDHQLDHDLQAPLVRGLQESPKIVEGSIARVYGDVVRDIVTVIPERGREEGKKPETGYAEVGEVIQFLNQAGEIPDSVVVAVVERSDVQLINYRILEPQRIPRAADRFRFIAHAAPFGRLLRNTIVASGGSVRFSECGRPCLGSGEASTPPRLPWPLPP